MGVVLPGGTSIRGAQDVAAIDPTHAGVGEPDLAEYSGPSWTAGQARGEHAGAAEDVHLAPGDAVVPGCRQRRARAPPGQVMVPRANRVRSAAVDTDCSRKDAGTGTVARRRDGHGGCLRPWRGAPTGHLPAHRPGDDRSGRPRGIPHPPPAPGAAGAPEDALPVELIRNQSRHVRALPGEELVHRVRVASGVGHCTPSSLAAIRRRASNRSRLTAPSDFPSRAATTVTGRSA